MRVSENLVQMLKKKIKAFLLLFFFLITASLWEDRDESKFLKMLYGAARHIFTMILQKKKKERGRDSKSKMKSSVVNIQYMM